MPNDQFGRPVKVGDKVIIKAEVLKVSDDPNFLNCTVKLAQQMPPGGTETQMQLNTAQMENQSAGQEGGAKPPQKPPQPPPPQPQPPPHAPAKK